MVESNRRSNESGLGFESEEQINTIIHGLKGLYSKLASQGK